MREALQTSVLPESLILSLGYDRGREWEWLLYASQEDVVAFPPLVGYLHSGGPPGPGLPGSAT
eukprot:6139941-Pyramimonas_sp.AAC.1